MATVTWDQFIHLENQIFPHNPMSIETYNSIMNHNGFVGLFVASQLVGYIHIKSYGDDWHIKKMGISPDHRRKGYGSKLLNWAISFCEKSQARSISLYVHVSNHSAILLYKKLGFFIQKVTRQYIIPLDETLPIDETKITDYTLSEMKLLDIEKILAVFPILNHERLKTWINADHPDHLLILRYNNQVRCYAKYSETLSGCMPFVYSDIQDVDYFIMLMKDSYLQSKKYMKLSIDNDLEIDALFTKRGYRLDVQLYGMRRKN